jgi:ferredoxin
LAGCDYFDLSAKVEIVEAAKRGLKRVLNEEAIKKKYLNVSIGIAGDPHVSKAKIKSDLCIACGLCVEKCEQSAIEQNDQYSINTIRCIGCGACIKTCPQSAIELYSNIAPFDEILPPLINLGLDSLELHAVTENELKALEDWKIMNQLFKGILSVCVDRSLFGSKKFIERLRKFLENRQSFSTIIQADGAPMSGADDKPSTTLEALATAQVVQKSNLPAYVLLSGGTNSKTTELARLFEIEFHGVAIGSYARKIIKHLITRKDFWENQAVFDEAVKIAKDLVDKSKKFM